MRKDVNELKKLVHGLISEGVIDRGMMEKHSDLFQDAQAEDVPKVYDENALIIETANNQKCTTYLRP